MDFQIYFLVVTFAAILYSVIAKEIQFRLTNHKLAKDLQERSKKVSEELKEASKRNDQKKLDEAMKRQMALIGEMNKMMFQNLKAIVPVIAVFLCFTYVLGMFDPTVTDDFKLHPLDDGVGCDKTAGDNIYSICHIVNGNAGEWLLIAKVYDGKNLWGQDNIVGEKSQTFFLGEKGIATHSPPLKGANISLYGLKEVYSNGEQLSVFMEVQKGVPEIIINNGTWFYADLPFTIPLLNVKRISEVYWWFIFVAFVFGLISAPILKKVRAMKGKPNDTCN
ncbi:MAG: EMC3/TMCO1 family protein [Candidatus Micrarchaeota archaeon]